MSAVATPVDEVQDMGTLSATDRCVRCGAQAYVRVRIASGTTLDFCKHDYEQHEPKLAETGAVVLVDDRQKLTAKPV